MKKMIRAFLLGLALMIGGCSQQTQQPAESKSIENQAKNDYPNKPIQLIVPAPPGGTTDTVARILAEVAPQYLPNLQSMVVVNKPGGSNTIGVAEVYKAKPDGYTLGFIPSSTITAEPHYGHTPYTHDSFQTIMRAYQQDGYMYIKSDAPWKTFDEWLAYVKQNPGQFSVSTVAGAKGLLETLNLEAKIEMKIVPFDGFAPATTALLGGHVQGTIAIPSAVRAQLDTGGPLFTSSGRNTGEAPTLKEKGIHIEENRVAGVIAPKGLPQDIVTVLNTAFQKALEDPKVLDQFKKLGLEPYYGNPVEFQKDLTDNFHIDGKMLRKSGLIK